LASKTDDQILGARPKIKDQCRPNINAESDLVNCQQSLIQCDPSTTGTSRDSSGLHPDVPINEVNKGETKPRFGRLLGFFNEKRSLQSIAMTPLSKSIQNPGKNSPARSRIKRGTVASLRSKFEGENGMNPKLENSTSVRKVIGLRSARKMTRKSAKKGVKSASIEVDQSQSTIFDYFGARNVRESVPGAYSNDLDPKPI